jgi:hypothetical protein
MWAKLSRRATVIDSFVRTLKRRRSQNRERRDFPAKDLAPHGVVINARSARHMRGFTSMALGADVRNPKLRVVRKPDAYS